MSNVTVRLDNSNYNYYPGNTITGQAVCYFRSPKEFRKIRIRLKGREHTHWTKTESYYDSSSKKTRTRTVSCNGDRVILLQDDIVLDEGSLPSGEHIFPIKFVLPQDIPSSYHCTYGEIKYTVKLTVDRPYKLDLEDKIEITVFSPIRLQDAPPRMLNSEELSDEKTVCCWCCAGGNIEMQVVLERKAFVVGQSGNVKVYCLNMSNNSVDELRVELTQKLIYKTTQPSDHKYDSELIAASHNSGVGAHGDKTYNLSLDIPPSTVVPNFTRCELFKCEYKLKITACVSGCHANLDISTDVTVGHVDLPLPGYFENAPIINQPMPMPMPMPIDDYGFRSDPCPPAYPSAPSASQAEAPSAPPKFEFEGTKIGMENTSAMETPPPSYDEAAKGLVPPKE